MFAKPDQERSDRPAGHRPVGPLPRPLRRQRGPGDVLASAGGAAARSAHPRGRPGARDRARRARPRPRHPRARLHAAGGDRQPRPRHDGRRADPRITAREEMVYSVVGVLILALGHDLNRRAVI